jgi:hypothetical protein
MKEGFIKQMWQRWFPPPLPREPDLPLFSRPEGAEEIGLLFRQPRADEFALGFALERKRGGGGEVLRLKGVPQEHRSTHFYIVGSTGTGKTKFLETLAAQDIENNRGFGVMDAHGDFTEDVKGRLYLARHLRPDFLKERVVLIDPSDPERTVCFNPLERTGGLSPAGIAGEVVEAFKKIWHDAWGARMEDLLKNSLIALIENDLTLAELPLFLSDIGARKKILKKASHPVCRQYFERFNSLRLSVQDEWAESTLNKVNALLSDDRVRQMFLAAKSTFNLRDVMDNGKILLVKLDKGRLKGSGELLGSLLLSKIQMAAFSRTDTLQSKRMSFYLYIDEFQNFATESFIQTLAEARKYKLSLILAHQNLAQLPQTLRASVLSNCGLQAYFHISRDDSNILAKESLASIYQEPLGWEFYVQSLQELPRRECVVKNKVDGGVVRLYTAEFPFPWEVAEMDEEKFAEKVAAANIGGAYLRRREEVEKEYRLRREALAADEEPESFKEAE